MDTLRIPISQNDYRTLRAVTGSVGEPDWAIEGRAGLAASLIRRLATDGLAPIDVLPTLAARVRARSTGRRTAVAESGSRLTSLHRIGTMVARTILDRWEASIASAGGLASDSGTALIEVASGGVVRHRTLPRLPCELFECVRHSGVECHGQIGRRLRTAHLW